MKYEAVEQAKDYLLEKMGGPALIAVTMGGGISAVDEILSGVQRVHYVSIPNFPVPKVAGHRGQAVFGKVGQTRILVFEGRVHYYEGYTMPEVTFAACVLGRIGVETLILTNASGAINPEFQRGDLMLITDHINLIGANPLHGPNEDRWGPRFLDQTEVYDMATREKLLKAAADCEIIMRQGVYAALEGPTYETPAEIRFLRTIGADAVGMSTVPEAIVARHMGVKVGGISMLANVAAGISGKPISHEEVLASAAQMHNDLAMLLLRFFETYG